MESGIDPAPSITPCTVFEAGVELNSGANYATEGTGAVEKMAESLTESAESTLLSPRAVAVSGESEGRVLHERVSSKQGCKSDLDFTKTPRMLAQAFCCRSH